MRLVPPEVRIRRYVGPTAFTWRRKVHRVREILGRWHLRTRWWVMPGEPTPKAVKRMHQPIAWRPSNRFYFRLEVQSHMVMEVYFDRAVEPPIWILDVVHD
jgi:hypothetical protein